MLKISYQNSRKDRIKFVDSLPITPGKPSATENAGRFGFNLQEMARDIDGVMPTVKIEFEEPNELDLKPTIEFLSDLGDSLDSDDKRIQADFIDFIIKKMAEENNKNYLKKFNELMIKINLTDIPDTSETIKKLTKIFSKNILLEMSTGMNLESAYKIAYQKTLHRATQYLSNGKMIDKGNQNKVIKTADLNKNPFIVAQHIKEIIDVLVANFSPEAKRRAYPNLKNRILNLNSAQLAEKRLAGGAAIGVSISLIKNILNGKDPMFIRMVINNLARILK